MAKDKPAESAQKKIRAYPFPLQIKTDAPTPISGRVAKLSGSGFLAEVEAGLLKVGDKGEATFQLPGVEATVTEKIVVVKTYDQFASTSTLRIAEIHFRSMKPEAREAINLFLRSVGRTG